MKLNETDKISRRDFAGWIIKGGLLATLAGMILPALEYLLPVMRRGPGGGLKEIAKLDEIPVWGSKKVVLGGSAFILIRTATEVKAFSAVCTHLGCLVDWNGQKREIICPCHAGQFALDGHVVGGPPPRPLPSYPARVVDGKIFVEL